MITRQSCPYARLARLLELPFLSLNTLGVVSHVEPRFSGLLTENLVHRCNRGLGCLPLSGNRWDRASMLCHLIRHANVF